MHSFRRVRRLPKSDDATSGVRDPTFEFKSLLFTRGGGKKRGEEEESSGFGCFSHLKYIDKKKKNLTRQERLTWEITQDVSILSVVHHWNRGDSGGSASDYYTSDQASNPSHDRYCSGIHPALKCAPGSCDKEGEGGGARN